MLLFPPRGTHLCSFLLVATLLTTSIALGERNQFGKNCPLPSLLMDIYLTSFLHPHASHSPPLPHTLPLLYFVPHFLCATLRWAGSSFTTNTPSLVPTEERHWNMEEWKVEGGRWRGKEGGRWREVEGEGGGRKVEE